MSVRYRIIASVVGSTILMLSWVCVRQSHQLKEARHQQRLLRDQRGEAMAFAQHENEVLRARLGYGGR